MDFWDLLASWGFRKELVDLEPKAADGPAVVVKEPLPEIFTLGAWCGYSTLKNPKRDVDFAKSIGLSRLDIIVNDHSADRLPRRFDMRDAQEIVTLAKLCEEAGIEVHLMSWCMPHADYLKGAADQLLELREKMRFESIQWDAEEPWTLAKKGMGYQKAADLIAERFAGRDFEMGVNGIRYAPTRKLKPLTAICDYWTPQCYATNTSKADPSTVSDKGVATWTKKFGKAPRWVIGVAGYRQDGINGHKTPRSAVMAALEGAAEHCDEAVIWSLASLRRSNSTAAGVRDFTARHEK